MNQNNSNDYELLYMIYQMDEFSLQFFVKKYRRYMKYVIHRYFWRLNVGYCDDDLLLEGMQVLFISIYAFRDDRETRFSTYFYNSIKNRFVTMYRGYCRRLRLQHGEVLELDCMVEDTNSHHMDHMVNRDITLEGIYYLYIQEYYETLRQVFQGLLPKEREIIKMRILGYPYDEIAKTLKIDVKKVDNTLTKVRNAKV